MTPIDKLREALTKLGARALAGGLPVYLGEPLTEARAALDELTKERTEAILKALKNAGVDMKCGACVEVGCTGATLAEHTCGQLKEFAELRRNLRGMGEVLDWQDMSLRDACLSLVARLEHQLSAQPKPLEFQFGAAPRTRLLWVFEGELGPNGDYCTDHEPVAWLPLSALPPAPKGGSNG